MRGSPSKVWVYLAYWRSPFADDVGPPVSGARRPVGVFGTSSRASLLAWRASLRRRQRRLGQCGCRAIQPASSGTPRRGRPWRSRGPGRGCNWRIGQIFHGLCRRERGSHRCRLRRLGKRRRAIQPVSLAVTSPWAAVAATASGARVQLAYSANPPAPTLRPWLGTTPVQASASSANCGRAGDTAGVLGRHKGAFDGHGVRGEGQSAYSAKEPLALTASASRQAENWGHRVEALLVFAGCPERTGCLRLRRVRRSIHRNEGAVASRTRHESRQANH